MSKDFQLAEGRVLVVGLGNPGSRYDGTRHNIGFAVIDELARRWRLALSDGKFKARDATGTIAGRDAVLLQPQTYMNLSGESVQAAARFYKRGPDAVIVAHDDIDLPPGKVKLKVGGGHGGHNGLRSCDKHLPSKEYVRVRLGVGRPPHPQADVAGWVLGRFGSAESALVDHLVDVGADAVEAMIREGLLEAQGKIHPIPVPK